MIRSALSILYVKLHTTRILFVLQMFVENKFWSRGISCEEFSPALAHLTKNQFPEDPSKPVVGVGIRFEAG